MVESLESRIPLAADLELTAAVLVDVNNTPISNVVIGERAFVRAEWRTTDLTSNDKYFVHYEMNGIVVASAELTGQAGTNLAFNWYRGVGYSGAGTQQVRVTVDGAGQIAESDEGNNQLTINFDTIAPDLVEKWQYPVGGVPFEDWTLTNYTDVDLREGFRSDFRGGEFQYDGHDALDVPLANFAAMDAGVPIYAVAGGTVVESVDGNFDRITTGPVGSPRSNYVAIDHGNGWMAYYLHLARDSVAVEVGQQVTAGTPLGLNGSSGQSTDVHLHLSFYRNGSPVEPMFAPQAYFDVLMPYQGDRVPNALDWGITDQDPESTFKERPSTTTTFPQNIDRDAWVWFRLSHMAAGERIYVEWYRPDGSLDARYEWVAPNYVRYGAMRFRRDVVHSVGQWTVVALHESTELFRDHFSVTAGGGAAEIEVRQGETYIIDRRSTPIDFGTSERNDPGPELTFTVENAGTANLGLQGVSVPAGFEIVDDLPAFLAPGESADLNLRMQTSVPGSKFGEVSIRSNDADEPLFRFIVEGLVNGSLPSNVPMLTEESLPLVVTSNFALAPIFPTLQISDSDNANYSGARVKVEILTGQEVGDRIELRQLGGTTPELKRFGSQIVLDDQPVARVLRDGSDGIFDLQFTSAISPSAAAALLQRIAFWQQASTPSSRLRTVELTVTDPSGSTSAPVRRTVYYGEQPLVNPPTIEPLINRTIEEDAQLTAIQFEVDDLETPLQDLQITATSSNTQLLPQENLNVQWSGTGWRYTASPAANQFGETIIQITARNNAGLTDTAYFRMTVTSVNDTPTVTPISDQSIVKNTTTGPITFTVADVEDATPTVDISWTNPSLIGSGVSLTNNGNRYTLTITPAADQSGESQFTVTVTDSNSAEATEQFNLLVAADVAAPTISEIGDLQMNEDATFTQSFLVIDNDTPADQLQVAVSSSNPSLFPNGSLTLGGQGSNRTLQLSPATDRFGQAVITVFAIDLQNNIARRTFTVTVNEVNDLPTLNLPAVDSADEDSGEQVVSLSGLNAGGGESQPLSLTWPGNLSPLLQHFTIDYTSPSSVASLRWEPTPEASGSVEIPITLTDGGLDGDLNTTDDNARVTRTLTLAITPINDPPSFSTPANLTLTEDAAQQIVFVQNITAGPNEGDPLRLEAIAGNPELFSELTVNYNSPDSSATVSLTPAANRFGISNIVLQLEDGGLDQDLATSDDNATTSATFTVTIRAENDAPIFNVPATVDSTEDITDLRIPITQIQGGPFESDAVRIRASGADPQQLTSLTVEHSTGASTGDVVLTPVENLAGTVVLLVIAEDAGTDGVFSTSSDNATTTQTVSVNLAPVNDPPIQINVPTDPLPENAAGHVLGMVTAEDPDEGDSHTWSVSDDRFEIVASELRLKNQLALDYEAEQTVTVSVTATDTGGASLTHTATITVMDANDPPTDLSVASPIIYEEILSQSLGRLAAVDQDQGQTHTFESLDDRFEVSNGNLRLRPGIALPAGTDSTLEIPIRTIDSGSPSAQVDLNLTLTVHSVQSPWQNPIGSLDVNADEFVSPIDALLVINFLNQSPSNPLSAGQFPPQAIGPYWDTNGDRNASPIDALLVINHLNSSGAGEGEQGSEFFAAIDFFPMPMSWGMTTNIACGVNTLADRLSPGHPQPATPQRLATASARNSWLHQRDWALAELAGVDQEMKKPAKASGVSAAVSTDFDEALLENLDDPHFDY